MSTPQAVPFGPLVMIGAGNMGGAMLRRWIDSGVCVADDTIIVDRAIPAVATGVRVVAAIDALPAHWRGATVVLAVKPQQLGEVEGAVAALAPRLLVSILAGVTHVGLRAASGGAPTIRAMPNLPVAFGRGVVALHGELAADIRTQVDALMAPLGLIEWIDGEASFDAVTALSGCGPAFTFRFVDALAKAGIALGLPVDQAARLALATVEGSATMLRLSGESAAIVADRVASPGGSTREGLNVLDRDAALDRLLGETLAASRARNRELGG